MPILEGWALELALESADSSTDSDIDFYQKDISQSTIPTATMPKVQCSHCFYFIL